MTGSFEQKVLRGMLWGIRHAYGVRGSKRKPPATIRSLIPDAEDHEKARYVELMPDDVAAKAVLPVFTRPPAILVGGIDQEVSPDDEVDWVLLYDEAAAERMKRDGHPGISVMADVHSFVRTIAKSAHAQSVGRFGVDGFEPFLLDVIAAKRRNWPYLVGADVPLIGDPERHHEIWMQLAVQERSQLIIARMQFFSSQDTPIYSVVVGRKS